jgi:hypothetical protein
MNQFNSSIEWRAIGRDSGFSTHCCNLGLKQLRSSHNLPAWLEENVTMKTRRGIATRTSAVVASLAALTGSSCSWAPHEVVPEPNAISLESALVGTVDAFNAAYARSRSYGAPIGYYPCTLSATFNISATGTAQNKLAVGINGGVSGATISGSASNENDLTAARGNVVVVTLASSLCLPSSSDSSTAAKPAVAAKPSTAAKPAVAAKPTARGSGAARQNPLVVPAPLAPPPSPNQ